MALRLDDAVEALRAAGEPTRLRILSLLVHGELAVTELCQILGQSQPRVSRHLRLLTSAGLVDRFPDGGWVFYRLGKDRDRSGVAAEALRMVDAADALPALDAERLERVRAERAERAQAYFERNAAGWDHLRSLYVAEADVEAAIARAAPPGPIDRMVDLGSGSGRMLTLLAPRARQAIGLDLSRHMLDIARVRVAEAGLSNCELRHGDIFDTGLPDGAADLVVVHQVLHYLLEPAAAVREAARLIDEDGRLLIVDFAPHDREFLRDAHQHRRLGFDDDEMERWLSTAGLTPVQSDTLPGRQEGALTVKIWAADRLG